MKRYKSLKEVDAIDPIQKAQQNITDLRKKQQDVSSKMNKLSQEGKSDSDQYKSFQITLRGITDQIRNKQDKLNLDKKKDKSTEKP